MSLTPDQRFVAKRAAELLQQGSCKGTYARDISGLGVSEYSPEAHSFCLIGALRRARLEGHREHIFSEQFVHLAPIFTAVVPPMHRCRGYLSEISAVVWWDELPASGQLLAIAKLAELGSEQTLPPPASPD